MEKHIFEQHRILYIGMTNGLNGPVTYSNIYAYHDMYKKSHGIDKYLYRLSEHGLSLKPKETWYGDWKKKLDKVDTVMLSDGIRGRDIIEYIHRRNPKARIIVYYMNPNFGGGRNDPRKYRGLTCEMYTFDKKNAEDYGITFKHYYYPYMEMRTFEVNPQASYKQDIFFIGEDKGRLEKLLQWKETFERMGLTCKFFIVKSRHRSYAGYEGEVMSQTVPYDQVIQEIRQSRAILDVMQEKQHGITWRPMEAMCFQKKLITTFEEIRNYNFYDPRNIFLLGHDDVEGLKDFLKKPYEPIDDSIRQEYVAADWLDSFFR